ncbi:methylated-DNA--[protein]-cysteine S-methyltransferase [Cellulomonas sp. DKR-3]|uniref:Methylated-DNA--protein-cysteine methyltransferase n=1 Tax=Cellulomonas fulva TaxID=2835530 RepID=A0ABS5TW22_9CELL|nr:methylated-DNA--[protein]-cysteine S-methyltransferase [Cellulomonas fulva]MBT0993340.1 methylated-DNA--[protein]-cysteine S-methyltransferase [Cellulomonas fulva]
MTGTAAGLRVAEARAADADTGAEVAAAVHAVLGTSLGDVVLAATVGPAGAAITHLRLPHGDGSAAGPGPGMRVDVADEPVLAAAAEQLTAYLAGELREFDLPLAYAGTDFQRRVWDGLRRIPYGSTTTYGDLAATLGLDPRTTARAVGAANGANRIAVVVPCHRVIGADGTLTGFAAGVERKRELLDLEASVTGAATLFGGVTASGRPRPPGSRDGIRAARGTRPRRPVDNRRLF